MMAENDDTPKGDPRRFVADAANDMAIGIGPSGKLRFIGMGLLEKLKADGATEDEVYARIKPGGRAAMVESQLLPIQGSTAKLSVWDKALGAIDPK